MATYVIGDIQGSFDALKKLLNKIQFNDQQDILWSTGDLVNRGSQSLQVLRFYQALGDQHRAVLGNHDLHLLAVASGARDAKSTDTLTPILSAADKKSLLAWLCHRPLLVHENGYVLVHAGLAPAWDLAKAKACAQEVESVLQGSKARDFFNEMYGNQPDHWDDKLKGNSRLRCIVNYFTRMRYCYSDGRLELSYKGGISHKPEALLPWFDVEPRANRDLKIIFGHWAALGAKTTVPNLYPMDGGCVWGNQLTAMRLEDEVRFSVECK